MRFVIPTLSVLLSTLLATAATAGGSAADATAGKQLFRQRCAMCHTVKPGAPASMGPNLSDVSGRKAGTTSFSYTPAMKKSGITWDKAHLEKLLANPSKTVPGSTMLISVPDAAEREAIIAYLASLKT